MNASHGPYVSYGDAGGSGRKEEEVRRLLDTPPAPLPADLAPRATVLGTRLLHRRRALRRVGWAVLLVAAVAFTVWAAVVEPWSVPPAATTPEIDGW
ncbi:hypothetical protein [Streptomyces sp. NPDC127084]|uniref:hypothetical protein n=1 Tax=Streptomyces sp. NPDC127084 TaxID=3347133 RepID=UPI003662DE05